MLVIPTTKKRVGAVKKYAWLAHVPREEWVFVGCRNKKIPPIVSKNLESVIRNVNCESTGNIMEKLANIIASLKSPNPTEQLNLVRLSDYINNNGYIQCKEG
jgi:hypothetical protein